MRRRRLVDVLDAGDSWAVIALFRDTHVDQSGIETVLHEYSLTATVDPAAREFTYVSRHAQRVLPWVVPSGRGQRRSPRRTASTTACAISCGRRSAVRPRAPTFNDLLRSLGDIGTLVRA